MSGLAVDSGSKSSGAILLIDASNSMAGAPIDGRHGRGRAFMTQRKDDLPVAVIAYNPETRCSPTSRRTRGALGGGREGTAHIRRHAHLRRAHRGGAIWPRMPGYARTTAVLLSDGHRRGVQATQEGPSQALNAANVRVHLGRPAAPRSTTPRRCRAWPKQTAARTSRARRRSSSSRSSRRSASSSRTSTSSATARFSRRT